MIQFYASRKLLKKLVLDDNDMVPITDRSDYLTQRQALAINPLSGWHADLINKQRKSTVIMVHDSTRYPLVLPALTKLDFTELNDRFQDALMNTLLKTGADDNQLNVANHFLRPLKASHTLNRSAQATLTRMKLEIDSYLMGSPLQLAEMTGYPLGVWLAHMPRTAKGHGCLHPEKEMIKLLDQLAHTITP